MQANNPKSRWPWYSVLLLVFIGGTEAVTSVSLPQLLNTAIWVEITISGEVHSSELPAEFGSGTPKLEEPDSPARCGAERTLPALPNHPLRSKEEFA